VSGLLDGELAVVTGGGHGIGRATAERMASEGAQVAVIDLDGEAAASTAAACGGTALVADVADGDAFTAAVDEAARALGGLTVLFNNAGVGMAKPLGDVTDDEWALLLDVNLRGTWHGIRGALPHLRAAGRGAIVNMAGTTALRPARGEGPYAAAKAGVIALTKAAALEYVGRRFSLDSMRCVLASLQNMNSSGTRASAIPSSSSWFLGRYWTRSLSLLCPLNLPPSRS
jgi:NAD(P)-dependent dehydrogenase (short-subunit alcohol dehydrogenase family)